MSDEKKPDAPKASNVDDELSELLDSALEDFKKDDKKGAPEAAKKPDESESQAAIAPAELEEWTEDFIKQAAASFESNLSAFLGPNPDGTPMNQEQFQEQFKKIAETAQQIVENPEVTENSSDFASTITQTLQGLSAGAEGLQNPFSEQDLQSFFGNQGDQNAFFPFMQGMMQSLLSKDVLYPSLKDILDKFPEYLEKNKDSVPKEDLERYQNQAKLMEQVCAELDKETPSDGVDVKRERFEKVLELMQKLQDYGQPPTELVGDVGPPIPPEMQNNLDPNQCSLM